MDKYIDIFKGLSDETRLKIVWLLIKARSSLCVCEIMDSLAESQYNVSRHLKVLKNSNLVKENREGRWVYYSLSSPESEFLKLVYEAISAIPEEFFYPYSLRLNLRLSLRKKGKCIVGIESEEWQKILINIRRENNVQKTK